MFERFTHAARESVVRAQLEARDLGQSPIGTQHVLLALLSDSNGAVAKVLAIDEVDARHVRAEIIRRIPAGPAGTPAADLDADDRAALKAIGIDLDAVRHAIEENFGRGALRLPRAAAPKRRKLFGRTAGRGGHVPFSPRAKKVLELSLREALRLKHNFIAPEHILLGLLREGAGLGMQILVERGVDIERLRDGLTRSLNEPVT